MLILNMCAVGGNSIVFVNGRNRSELSRGDRCRPFRKLVFSLTVLFLGNLCCFKKTKTKIMKLMVEMKVIGI